jgi:hypothetical protein
MPPRASSSIDQYSPLSRRQPGSHLVDQDGAMYRTDRSFPDHDFNLNSILDLILAPHANAEGTRERRDKPPT